MEYWTKYRGTLADVLINAERIPVEATDAGSKSPSQVFDVVLQQSFLYTSTRTHTNDGSVRYLFSFILYFIVHETNTLNAHS